jgi:hypothetical protein
VNRSHHLPVTAMVVMPIVMPMIAVRVVAVVTTLLVSEMTADGSGATGAAFDALQTATKASPTTAIANTIRFISILL